MVDEFVVLGDAISQRELHLELSVGTPPLASQTDEASM